MPVPPPSGAKKVFAGVLASAYQWDQTLYDGRSRIFECFVRPDTATVIPFLDSKTVLLTKQEQPGKDEPFWDFPGGRVEEDETLETGAKREFEEETGRAAGRWMLWMHRRHNGLIRYEQGLYIATDIAQALEHNPESDGERIELVPTDWNDLIQRCLKKQLRQPDVMLNILAMEFDPEQRKRLDAFLEGK